MKTFVQIVHIVAFVFISQSLCGQEDVMDFEMLQNYLPIDVSGYIRGEPGGSGMSTNGISFSSADIEFTGPENRFIRITLLDYAGATTMFEAATAMWSSGMNFEDDHSKVSTYEVNDQIKGWEEFRKPEGEAQIALGIGKRFFLTIEANDQSGTSFIKEIATGMKLEELMSK